MRFIHCDIETYSSVDLGKSGVYKYAEAEDFEILLFGYSVDGGKVQVIDLGFHQRYFRCKDCENLVFHENIDFAEEGCKFSNRLSDLIAEGTLTRTYERVC